MNTSLLRQVAQTFLAEYEEQEGADWSPEWRALAELARAALAPCHDVAMPELPQAVVVVQTTKFCPACGEATGNPDCFICTAATPPTPQASPVGVSEGTAERALDALDEACGAVAKRSIGEHKSVSWRGFSHADRLEVVTAALAAQGDEGKGS